MADNSAQTPEPIDPREPEPSVAGDGSNLDPAAAVEVDKLELILPDESDHPRDQLLWGLVILILLAAVYVPAIRATAFLWDDDRHVTANPTLRSIDGLRDIWTKIGATPQYYPLTHTTYWLEYRFAPASPGGGPDPMVFHITNVALHGISAILLWFILRRLRVAGAWLIAMIWAIHPIQAESVAWISERKNVLSAAFFLGSMLAYLHTFALHEDEPRKSRWGLYALSLLLFAGALLSKTVTCSLPAALVLILWWKHRLSGRQWLLLAPMFIAGAGMAGLTAWMERALVGAVGPEWNLNFIQRLLLAGRALWFYVVKLVAPTNLVFNYPRWNLDPTQPWQWIYIAGAVAAIALLWIWRRSLGRGALAAVLIYAVVLFPALGFFNVYPMRYSFVADHFQYLAGISLIALIVGSLGRWLSRPVAATATVPATESRPMGRIWAVAIFSAIVLAVLGVLTVRQAATYANPQALWRATLARNPDSWLASYNLGVTLAAESRGLDQVVKNTGRLMRTAAIQGRLGDLEEMDIYSQTAAREAKQTREEAALLFERTVELRSEHEGALNNWGTMLLADHPQQAIALFRRAADIDPANYESRMNLGEALTRFAEDQLDQARELVRSSRTATGPATSSATAPVPLDKAAASRQARALSAEARENFELAQDAYRQAIGVYENPERYRPRLAHPPVALRAQIAAAELLGLRGKKTEALKAIEDLLTRAPNHAEALAAASRLAGRFGQAPQAIEYARRAIAADPDFAPAHVELGLLLIESDPKKAIEELETAVKIRPLDDETWADLGALYVQQSRLSDGWNAYLKAIQVNPNNERAIKGFNALEAVRKVPGDSPATTQAN